MAALNALTLMFVLFILSFVARADDLPPGPSQARRCAAYLEAQAPTDFEEIRRLRYKMVVYGQIISEAEQQRIAELTAILRRAHGRMAEIWNRDVPGLHPYRIRPMIDDVLTLGRESFEVFVPRAGEGTDRVEAGFSEGLMVDGRGHPVSTVKWVEYMDGRTADVGLFCMDGEGRFFLLPQGAFVMGQNRHYDIQYGMPMAACGEITVLKGEVTYIQNNTGHYLTPSDFFDQALTELRRHGALATDAIIEYYRPLR